VLGPDACKEGTMPVRVILFDLGGVVCRFVPERRMAALAEASALPPGQIRALVWESGYEAECERGLHTTAEIHREVCRRLGLEMSYERFRSVWALAFEPDHGVLRVADSVRQWVRTALFTNNGPVLLDAMPVLLGAVKPEPAAFSAALARLNKEPGDVLLVDDSPSVVDGARAAGLHSVLFTTADALRADLAAHVPGLG
jgi:glucose-1-phosphatase